MQSGVQRPPSKYHNISKAINSQIQQQPNLTPIHENQNQFHMTQQSGSGTGTENNKHKHEENVKKKHNS